MQRLKRLIGKHNINRKQLIQRREVLFRLFPLPYVHTTLSTQQKQNKTHRMLFTDKAHFITKFKGPARIPPTRLIAWIAAHQWTFDFLYCTRVASFYNFKEFVRASLHMVPNDARTRSDSTSVYSREVTVRLYTHAIVRPRGGGYTLM